MSAGRRLALALCGAMAVHGTLQAQQQINVGQSVNGVLTVSSPQWQDGARYTAYAFMGQAGQQITITMNSNEFDPLVILQDGMGNEISRDDDGGEGVNAMLMTRLSQTGMYRIIAKAYRSDLFGNFTLSLMGSTGVAMNQPQQLAPQPMGLSQPTMVGQIAVNQQVTGNLTSMDGRFDGKPAQAWNFSCTAGLAFQMDILSDWDNYALVFDPMGNVVVRDDDSGDENLNARLTHTCTTTGVYRLAVTTFSTSTTPGMYTLQVRGSQAVAMNQPMPMNQPQPMNPQPQPQSLPGATMPTPVGPAMPITGSIPTPGQVATITLGTNVQGRLETGDQQMNDGTWADVWNFSGTAGQRVRIELRSEEFDTYLQLLDARGNRLAEDDDSLGDLDSMLEFTLPSSGTFQIVVNNFSDERRAGIYTLTLR